MKKVLRILAMTTLIAGCTSVPKTSEPTDRVAKINRSVERAPAEFKVNEPKKGRDGVQYVVTETNELRILLPNFGKGGCTVTANLADFRMIPGGDNVLAYETKDNELVLLKKSTKEEQKAPNGDCPSQNDKKKRIDLSGAAVSDWKTVNTGSNLALIARTTENDLIFVKEDGKVLGRIEGKQIIEYRAYPCFGMENRPFNEYIAYGLSERKNVVGVTSDGRYHFDEQMEYADLNDFERQQLWGCEKVR